MPAAVPLHPYKERVPGVIYWPYRLMRTIGVALCFAEFWGGAVIFAWLWLPILWLWPGTREQKIRRVLRSVRRGFNLFHLTMRVLRLYHRRSPYATLRLGGAPASSPVVMVANHPTLCDTTSIISMFPNIVTVARPGLANHQLLRRVVRATGFVPLGIHLMKDCQDRLAMGLDLLIYPEGTRSPVGGLHPFHRGAFELALRAKVPLVLVKLVCAPSALSKRLPIWKHPDKTAVLTVEVFDTIEPGTFTDSRAMCRAVEQRYREVLGYAQPPESVSDVSKTA